MMRRHAWLITIAVALVWVSTSIAENESIASELKNLTIQNLKACQDEDYAVARIKEKVTKVAGPSFQNNEADAIVAFRKEKGKWKFWNQVIVEIKYIND